MGRGNLAELRKITTFMRKNGLLVFRNADFEIRLSRQAFKLPKPKITKDERINMEAPMDLRLWSAPDLPEEMG